MTADQVEPSPTVLPEASVHRLHLLQVLLDNLHVGVVLENATSEIILLNRAWCVLVGWSPEPAELLPMPFSDFFQALKRWLPEPEFFLERKAATVSLQRASFAEEVRFNDGRFLARDYIPLELERGEAGHLWLYRDVTAEKGQEALLRQAMEEAEAGTRAKSLFLANMSHEIRTPLNGILGMTRLMLGDTLTDEQRHRALAVKYSADNLLALLNDILDFSKIEAGKLELEVVPFDLPRLVRAVADLLEPKAQAKQLPLQALIAQEVPRWVEGDPVRLRQILLNLGDNAVKFTESGRVSLRLKCLAQHRGTCRLRFEVEDTGPGISDERREKLFQSFSQLEASTHRHHGGTGLGLAISQQLTGLMGGEIFCDTEEGKGTCFSFEISLSETDAQSGQAHERPEVAQEDLPPLHVLLAEDNPINQEVAKGTLAGLGVTFEVVGDGRAVVEAAARGKYDVILMDIRMPELDGLSATNLIREQGIETPVIALTAHAMRGELEHFLVEGINGYVTKPLEPEALADELRRVLQLGKVVTPQQTPPPFRMEQPVFDFERFQKMFARKEDLRRRIALQFISHTKEKLAKAMTVLAEQDRKQVIEVFHNIAGSAANIGATQLGKRCGSIERMALEDAPFAALVPQAEEAFEDFCKVEELLSRSLKLQEV